MVHTLAKPSVDLEGGESAPIARRPSTLRSRAIQEEGSPAARAGVSPTLSTSPTYSRPSPFLDAQSNSSYFSTLPPSPPVGTIELAPTSTRYIHAAEADYPTPPASVPGSAKAGSGFTMGLTGVTVVVDDGRAESRQSSSSEGEDSWNGGNISSELAHTLYAS